MSTSYGSLFALYALPTGRIRFCLSVLRPLAGETGDAALIARIDAAAARAAQVYAQEAGWATQRKVSRSSRGRASAIDPFVDRLVSATYETLERAVRSLPDGHPLRALAQTSEDRWFPNGSVAITSLAYDEELVAVEWLLTGLQKAEADVADLGLAVYTAELAAIIPQYRAELEKLRPKGLTYDELRAERRSANEQLLRVVARIADAWADDDQAETRERLLAPILLRNERVGAIYRSRALLKDVDPATGDELDEPVPGPDVATTPADSAAPVN